jgi:hypothetical protein
LTLKLTPFIAETLPLWANKIEPVIEQVKDILWDNGPVEINKITHLVIDQNLMT